MSSIWNDTAKKPEFETLKNDINTDVLIVGGGLAGILCAYALSESNINYTLMIIGKSSEYADIFSPSRSMLSGQLFINSFEAVTNILTPTVPRCPHLGCTLKYNKEEHSWDCPCHGSRFAPNGKLLDNPATDDKKF